MKIERSRTTIRIEALWRYFLLNSTARILPSLLITEYPKSGGTWLSLMLADLTGYAFPRNQFPSLGKTIFHGHYLHRFSGVPSIVLWRDPRDIMVSWYHHSLFKSEKTNAGFVEEVRNSVSFEDYDNIEKNLPDFIEFAFTRQRSPHFTWNVFFDVWSKRSKGVIHTSYEVLRISPVEELLKVMVSLGFEINEEAVAATVDKFSFERMSGRKAGDEKSGTFLRKGIVGDWKNVFSDEAAERLAYYMQDRIGQYEEFSEKQGFCHLQES